MRPCDRSQRPFNLLPAHGKQLFISAKPQTYDSKAYPSCSSNHPDFSSEQSILVDVMSHQEASSRYEALAKAIEQAVERRVRHNNCVHVKKIVAVWKDQGKETQKDVDAENVGDVVSWVALGNPWSYLVFDFAFKDDRGSTV